eukprot:TRINITY_DN440_c0_g2_i1.p2 TRINITY_DN440_c0_g2~~TRINITY_DN440_c0_g2_i1.p2  ORF type:complete len:107 (-),score=27.69 TRINITY_DN440_c0_g2_i1:81-401(-)
MLFVACVAMLYHTAFLIPLSLYYNEDYDSMLCAPQGIPVGKWWREIEVAGALIFVYFLYSLPEGVACWVYGQPAEDPSHWDNTIVHHDPSLNKGGMKGKVESKKSK